MPPAIQASVQKYYPHGLSLPYGKRKSPTKFKTLIETRDYPFKGRLSPIKKLNGIKKEYQ